MTTVVHVRDVLDRLKAGDPEVVYIGRAMPRRGLRASVFANPNKIGRTCSRIDAIELFRWMMASRLRGSQGILWQAQLRDLRGKTLACWCKPSACHGDVLAELADAA